MQRALESAGIPARRRRQLLAGQFQPYNHTLPDRYPWLFRFAADVLPAHEDPRLLSFGCSVGDEVFALAEYFPQAKIKGLDIDPRNIARARRRARAASADRVWFATARDTSGERPAAYDAVFCLAVLCNGDLINSGAPRCDPLITFAAFEAIVTDFARCLRPGGHLFLLSANFRFCDTAVASEFEVVCRADPVHLSPQVLFDHDNTLMPGAQYHDVGFRKSGAPDG